MQISGERFEVGQRANGLEGCFVGWSEFSAQGGEQNGGDEGVE